jgi:hypothetical protein
MAQRPRRAGDLRNPLIPLKLFLGASTNAVFVGRFCSMSPIANFSNISGKFAELIFWYNRQRIVETKSERILVFAGEKRSCLHGSKNRKWAITMERSFFASKRLSKRIHF